MPVHRTALLIIALLLIALPGMAVANHWNGVDPPPSDITVHVVGDQVLIGWTQRNNATTVRVEYCALSCPVVIATLNLGNGQVGTATDTYAAGKEYWIREYRGAYDPAAPEQNLIYIYRLPNPSLFYTLYPELPENNIDPTIVYLPVVEQ